MRVLVCGGRDFYNKALLKHTLDELNAQTPFTCLMHGDGNGADFLARQWAIAYGGMEHKAYKADWNAFGKSAGPIRNKTMLELGKPDLVVAFPGGKGTADMVRQAKKAKVKVIQIKGELK